MFFSENLA